MYIDRWNEICFLLSESIQQETSEDFFEKQVIQALRVLDWKQYLGDFDIRPSFQVGASNRIAPDFVVKSNAQKNLFVIEIKQPNIPLNSGFQRQLFSYMRQLKLEYGILIGKEIQIFYDGERIKQEDPQLLETIRFDRDSIRGERFAKLFSKDNFNKEAMETFVQEILEKINREEDFKSLTSKILSNTFKDNLHNLIKQELIGEYDGELIDDVLEKIEINISKKVENEPDSLQNRFQRSYTSFQKKTGVIASIEDLISIKPMSFDEILSQLVKNFADRSPSSMMNTIRAQLGGSSPLRMEKERNIQIKIIVGADNIQRFFSSDSEIVMKEDKQFISSHILRSHQTIRERDFSKYNIYINGIEENNLNKRQAIFLTISTAIKKGIRPEEMFSVTNKSRWIWVNKVCYTRDEFEGQKIQNRNTYDAKRWFVEDNELFIVGERTYAFSNQHSTEAYTIIANIFKKFPELNGTIEMSR